MVQEAVDAGTAIAERVLSDELRSSIRFVCSSVEDFAADLQNFEGWQQIRALIKQE